jgi:hypothetical protein
MAMDYALGRFSAKHVQRVLAGADAGRRDLRRGRGWRIAGYAGAYSTRMYPRASMHLLNRRWRLTRLSPAT